MSDGSDANRCSRPSKVRAAVSVSDMARPARGGASSFRWRRCWSAWPLFSLFLLALGKSPVDLYDLMWRGGFGSSFSIQNTLQRAAPLLLTGALRRAPRAARARHDRRRGRAGARRLRRGGHRRAAQRRAVPVIVHDRHGARRHGGRRLWIGAVGALRHYRGVNETISSLLMAYIAIAIMNLLSKGRCAIPPRSTSPRPCRSARPIASATFPAWTCIGAWPSASSPASCAGS